MPVCNPMGTDRSASGQELFGYHVSFKKCFRTPTKFDGPGHPNPTLVPKFFREHGIMTCNKIRISCFEMFTIIVKKLTHFFSKDFGFRVQFYAIKLNHSQIMKPIEITHQQYLKRLVFFKLLSRQPGIKTFDKSSRRI